MILNLKLARFLLLFLALFSGFAVFSQEKNSDNLDYFYVRGSVKEQFSSNPISNVTIEVNGAAYTITGIDGSFRIRVKKGDQLVVKGAELGCQHSSGQPGAGQEIDTPQYTQETVINMAKDYLEAEYLYDVESEIASSHAEYRGNGLWKVEFYGSRPQTTCPRQADSPLIIVYVDEQTGAFG